MNSQVPDTVSQTGEVDKQSGLITCINRQTVKVILLTMTAIAS